MVSTGKDENAVRKRRNVLLYHWRFLTLCLVGAMLVKVCLRLLHGFFGLQVRIGDCQSSVLGEICQDFSACGLSGDRILYGKD